MERLADRIADSLKFLQHFRDPCDSCLVGHRLHGWHVSVKDLRGQSTASLMVCLRALDFKERPQASDTTAWLAPRAETST
jgi:hypothetical protein